MRCLCTGCQDRGDLSMSIRHMATIDLPVCLSCHVIARDITQRKNLQSTLQSIPSAARTTTGKQISIWQAAVCLRLSLC